MCHLMLKHVCTQERCGARLESLLSIPWLIRACLSTLCRPADVYAAAVSEVGHCDSATQMKVSCRLLLRLFVVASNCDADSPAPPKVVDAGGRVCWVHVTRA